MTKPSSFTLFLLILIIFGYLSRWRENGLVWWRNFALRTFFFLLSSDWKVHLWRLNFCSSTKQCTLDQSNYSIDDRSIKSLSQHHFPSGSGWLSRLKGYVLINPNNSFAVLPVLSNLDRQYFKIFLVKAIYDAFTIFCTGHQAFFG